MNFTLMSVFPWIQYILPVGFIFGAIGNVLGGIFGAGKKTAAQAKATAAKELAAFKTEMSRQANLQAQESKKTLMYVGIGAVVLVIIMFMFLKK
jgi:hypothetical protein